MRPTRLVPTSSTRRARASIAFLRACTPNAQLNPAAFGILNGINQPIGLPQINVAGGGLNFGGPAAQPSGRGDTTFVVADTVSWLYGRHSLKLGGEYRQFLNNNFRQGTGSFNFANSRCLSGGHGKLFQCDVGQPDQQHRSGSIGIFCPGQLQTATGSYAGARPALRMEHDAERALRSVHRLRSEDGFARARRDKHRRDLSREQQEFSTACRLCLDALPRTARPCCAERTGSMSTNP